MVLVWCFCCGVGCRGGGGRVVEDRLGGDEGRGGRPGEGG